MKNRLFPVFLAILADIQITNSPVWKCAREHICGNGKLDVTIGSALDLFGGTMEYKKVIDYIEKARNGYE